MRRCIARPEDEPLEATAFAMNGWLACYKCLEAGRGVVILAEIRQTRTTQEPKIGGGGGVALVEQKRFFVGFSCPQSECPNHDVILEPEKVYLNRASGFLLKPEED